MIAFHGSQEIKDKYVARVKAHALADEIVQGVSWVNGKGCAVGCTLHGYKHSNYETELGVPVIIARLEDRIFEGLSNEEAKKFPLRFLESIPVGKDLSGVEGTSGTSQLKSLKALNHLFSKDGTPSQKKAVSQLVLFFIWPKTPKTMTFSRTSKNPLIKQK